jgi:hypothetical protein
MTLEKSLHHSPLVEKNTAPTSYYLQSVSTYRDLGSTSPPL